MESMLSGIKVIDLTSFLSGPFCTMTLSDMGANVIKIENPDEGCPTRQTPPFVNGQSAYFMSLNRGKKGVTLNLKDSQGKDILRKLLQDADVLVENFRPKVMDRLGFGYDEVVKINSRIIFASISGFGQYGPDSKKGAFDMVIQGAGGVMSITGNPGGDPVRVGYSIGDLAASLYAVIAIVGALRVRELTGEGQYLDISMFDCQIALLENAIARYNATNEIPGPLGSRHPSIVPFQAFKAQDGYFIVTASTDEQFKHLCDVVGLADLPQDKRFSTKPNRVKNREALIPILNDVLRKQTKEYWIRKLEENAVPCGPINNIKEVIESPHTKAREMVVTIEHPVEGALKTAGIPIKASKTPLSVQGPAPLLGKHTDMILSQLGYSENEIATLKNNKII